MAWVVRTRRITAWVRSVQLHRAPVPEGAEAKPRRRGAAREIRTCPSTAPDKTSTTICLNAATGTSISGVHGPGSPGAVNGGGCRLGGDRARDALPSRPSPA